jgi:hypothetical protein
MASPISLCPASCAPTCLRLRSVLLDWIGAGSRVPASVFPAGCILPPRRKSSPLTGSSLFFPLIYQRQFRVPTRRQFRRFDEHALQVLVSLLVSAHSCLRSSSRLRTARSNSLLFSPNGSAGYRPSPGPLSAGEFTCSSCWSTSSC